MSTTFLYRIVADFVLALHAGVVAFNVFGLLLIVAGLLLGWRWVRNIWFRSAHLLSIVVVVAQTLWGVGCPLTRWENLLRAKAGVATYPGGFVAYWLHRLIFYEAEPCVFSVVYTVFGLFALALFLWAGPTWPWRRRS